MFDSIVEQRIREAQQNGEFDDLPGAGAPLALDDDALVPEELRAAYRLLKNAGFLPPELEAHREIRALEQLLQTIEDGAERSRLLSRINFLEFPSYDEEGWRANARRGGHAGGVSVERDPMHNAL